MSSLDSDFNDLIDKIKHGREFGHASFEPIFYLVFHPDRILDVKRRQFAWEKRLSNEGWDGSRLLHRRRNRRHLGQGTDAQDLAGRRPACAAGLGQDQQVAGQCRRQRRAAGSVSKRRSSAMDRQAKSILLVTDLEALHPYMRIGVIEGQLQGKFHVPTVFFYPGVRTGKTRLKFLGFYPEDGNYRSVHVGG